MTILFAFTTGSSIVRRNYVKPIYDRMIYAERKYCNVGLTGVGLKQLTGESLYVPYNVYFPKKIELLRVLQ